MAFSGGATVTGSLGASAASPCNATPTVINTGDLVIVSIDADGVTSLDGVTDTLGNAYRPVAAQFATTSLAGQGAGFFRSFYAIATVGGSAPTVHGNFTGTTTSYAEMAVTRKEK